MVYQQINAKLNPEEIEILDKAIDDRYFASYSHAVRALVRDWHNRVRRKKRGMYK